MQPQPPFQNWSLTERNQRTLAPGSFDLWRVGGAVLTESQTLTSATYGQLPYTRLQLSANTTLPPYTQDVWDRTRNSGASISFFVFIQNTDVNQITISPGTGWTFVAYQISAGCACLLLVLDNGMGAIGVPMSPAAGVTGSFTVSTTGPLTATSPVNLGGNLALNNTALESIATNNWKAGTGSTFTPGRVNSVAIGHGITGAGSNAVNVGYLSLVGHDGVAVGANTIASAQSVAVGGSAQTASGSSVAMGYFSSAGGLESVSIGASSSNSGQRAISIGYLSSATAASTTAIGSTSTATATGATAVGTNSSSTAASTTAIGADSTATATGAVAVGSNASCSGGVAVGYNAIVDATTVGIAVGESAHSNDGVALGKDTYAGLNAVALGEAAGGYAPYSTALGKGTQVFQQYSAAIGYGVATNVTNMTRIGQQGGPNQAEHEVVSLGYTRSCSVACLYTDADLQLGATLADPTRKIVFNTTAFDYGGITLDGTGVWFTLPRKTDTSTNFYLITLMIWGPLTNTGANPNQGICELQETYRIDGVNQYSNLSWTRNSPSLDSGIGYPQTYSRVFRLPNAGALHQLSYRGMETVASLATPYVKAQISIYRLN